MPFLKAVGFVEPREDEKLWRYLDLSKYINILTTGGIWFSRSDVLGDSFEGSTTTLTKKQLTDFARSMVPDGEDDELNRTRIINEQDTLRDFFRTHIYINSWHVNDGESEAMWRLYSRDFGIAIVTTLNQIKDNLVADEEFLCGNVNYIDYESELIPNGNFLGPYVHKRRSFEHEKEFRVLFIYRVREIGDFLSSPLTLDQLKSTRQRGLLISANLNELISVVHVSPTAPDWFFKSVQDLTQKLGFTFEVKRSSLSTDPIF